MNKRTKIYADKIADVVKNFPLITKAVIVGAAVNDNFCFDEKIKLAIYTEPEAKISTVCVRLNDALGYKDIYNVDIYMMADEDFYMDVYDLIADGEVIFDKSKNSVNYA